MSCNHQHSKGWRAFSLPTTNDPWYPCSDHRLCSLGWRRSSLSAGGFPWHRSVHIHPKSRAREGLGVRKGHPRPWDSISPSRKVKGSSWPETWAASISGQPYAIWVPGLASPLPSALTFDHLGHQTGPWALQAHDSRASGRRAGGREGPDGQRATSGRERRSGGHTPEV